MKFCPKCGGPLHLAAVRNDPKERLVCGACGFIFYQDPKVSACTIPVVNGRVILVRRAINPGKGLWVFPGGYMDQDETVEEAAARETREEVGLDVRITRLVGVYSYRSPVVVVVYACAVVGGELMIDRESTEVRAFAPDEIPWAELAFPSTKDALRDFLSELRE
ncbi:MAG TPA: NUDIX hydrolase [Symbiobacteriaceae bacterium]|nr:NUDIX hydrolase [Symbiobacteriaceae bacterium]